MSYPDRKVSPAFAKNVEEAIVYPTGSETGRSVGDWMADVAAPSDSLVTATGGSEPRTLADWMADQREKLTATRVYYVRTDGSDSNNGLTNTGAGAFLTIQAAVDAANNSINRSSYNVVVSVEAGTYTDGVDIRGPMVGKGLLTLQGNFTTPANVVISTTNEDCFTIGPGADVRITGFKMQTTTSGDCINVEFGGKCTLLSKNDFGVSAGFHVNSGGLAFISGDYNITGGAVGHWHSPGLGTIVTTASTVTITGTPAFSSYFVGVGVNGHVQASMTFSGSATGKRFLVHNGGVINAGSSASDTYFPGDVAGESSDGGLYIGAKLLGQTRVTIANECPASSPSHTGDTNKTTLATIPIPAGMMGTRGRLLISAALTYTGTAGAKTAFVDFGGTTFRSVASAAGNLSASIMVEIANKSVANAQVGHGAAGIDGLGLANGVCVTGVINTAAEQDVTIGVTLADGSDAGALLSWCVELIK